MTKDKVLKDLNLFVKSFGYADDFKVLDEDSTQVFFELSRSEYMVTLDKEDGMLYAEHLRHIPGTYYDPPDQVETLLTSSKYVEDVCEGIFKDMLDRTKNEFVMRTYEETIE